MPGVSLPDAYPVETAADKEQRARDAADVLVVEVPELVELVLSDGPGGIAGFVSPGSHVQEAVAALLAASDGDIERAKDVLREALG